MSIVSLTASIIIVDSIFNDYQKSKNFKILKLLTKKIIELRKVCSFASFQRVRIGTWYQQCLVVLDIDLY